METYRSKLEEKSSYIDLKEIFYRFVKQFKKYCWLVIVVASLFAGMSYYRAKQSYTPMYDSSVTLSVTVKDSSDYYNNNTAAQMAQTYTYILTSNVMSRIVAKDLGLTYVPGSIQTEVVESTNLLIMTATSTDAEMAYRIVNSLINNYDQIADLVMSDAQVSVVKEPVISTEPLNQPDYKASAMQGLTSGAALVLVFILLTALNKTTITKASDIRKELGISLLGNIPVVRAKKRSKQKRQDILVTNPKTGFAFQEAYRSLRGKIERISKRRGAKVFVITSTLPSEGKTTTSINIALSLAQRGKKVVLLDCDLRKPAIQKTLNLQQPLHSVQDILTHKASLSQATATISDVSLVILAGEPETSQEDPTKYLSSSDMQELITFMKEEVDYVIIDSPPSAAMTDAAIMARYADAIIMVIKQDHAKISGILEAMDNVSQTRTRIVGCVLNQEENYSADHYGYGSYGYGGYGKYGKYGKYGRYGKYGKYAAIAEQGEQE